MKIKLMIIILISVMLLDILFFNVFKYSNFVSFTENCISDYTAFADGFLNTENIHISNRIAGSVTSTDFFINEALENFIPGEDISLFEDVTVYDFCLSITTSYEDFKVIDEDDNEWDADSPNSNIELMKDKYIFAGGCYSKILSIYSKTLKYENYDDDINDISSNKNIIRIIAEYSSEPLGGKENDRYMLVRDDREDLSSHGYLGYTFSRNYLVITEPIWITFSYYPFNLGNYNKTIAFSVRDDSPATPMANLTVTANEDNVVENTGYFSSDVHLINDNEWNRIAVRIYPETSKTDLIINGREYNYQNISSSGTGWQTNFRNLRFSIPTNLSGFKFAIDDVAIYAGEPKISFALPDVELVSESEQIQIDNDKRIAYIDKDMTEYDIYNNITASSDAIYKVLKDDNGSITKIAIPNGNLMFKYYDVIITGLKPIIKSFNADRKMAYVKLDGYTDNVVIVLAEYNGNSLDNIKIVNDISLRGETIINVDRPNIHGETECRVFLLNSLTDIIPLASSINVPSSEIYDYNIPDDPNYIADESFFGLWNSTESAWIYEPYFSYDEYPELNRVEDAVKAGDYRTAKKELLLYYQNAAKKKVSGVTTDPGDIARVRAELLEKNFYAVSTMNGSALSIFKVDAQWQNINIDVTSSIKSAIGSEKYRTFVIASIDKSDTFAEFASRESQNPPILTLDIGGEIHTLTADRDSYISAGINADTNYGLFQTIYVQESGTYQNHDEKTKRAYIAFDISSFKKPDEINSAILTLYGKNSSESDVKELLLYQWNDSDWQEDTVTWNYFSDHLMFSCNDSECWDYVTDKNPTIKGKVCFFHRGNELKILSDLYNYTKDDRYAYTFIRQFMGLIASIGVNPNVMNQLDMACHLNEMSEGLLRTIDSSFMTPERFTAALKHFWLMTEWLVDNYYGKATNNWGSFATLGVYSISARFYEFASFDRWFLATKVENDRLNQNFTRDDGSSIELAQGYVATLLNTLYNPVDISQITGVELPYSDYVLINFINKLNFYYIQHHLDIKDFM